MQTNSSQNHIIPSYVLTIRASRERAHSIFTDVTFMLFPFRCMWNAILQRQRLTWSAFKFISILGSTFMRAFSIPDNATKQLKWDTFRAAANIQWHNSRHQWKSFQLSILSSQDQKCLRVKTPRTYSQWRETFRLQSMLQTFHETSWPRTTRAYSQRRAPLQLQTVSQVLCAVFKLLQTRTHAR